MSSPSLSQLFKLPANERAELAMALWESLTDDEREAVLVLSADELAELDRRWAEHLADPSSAVPWDDVRRKLLARKAVERFVSGRRPRRRLSKSVLGMTVGVKGLARSSAPTSTRS